MTDTCAVAAYGPPTYDPVTGVTTRTPTTVYTGPCRVRPGANGSAGETRVGEQETALWPFVVSLPFATVTVDLNHVVTVTASGDPSLVGKKLRVREVARGTHITARRLGCDEAENVT